MIVVIIAGGSGTRLWPLSTPDYPKHLLKINGDNRSLVQKTYDRATRLAEAVYVVSEAGHIQHVKDQLPDLDEDNFIVEPARRGTASCIVAALAHVAQRHEFNESIVFLSADHYIRDIKGFVHSFGIACETSKNQKQIVLVGVEPDHPATGFGYIEKGDLLDEASYVYKVSSFKEKPDYDVAREYVQSGNYLWNCGYFVGSVDTFVEAMQNHAPDLYQNYQKLTAATKDTYQEVYLGFDNTTIDYGLIEKVDNLLVVPASFDWMDLGSFSDLHKAVEGDEKGNNVQGKVEIEEVENAFILNQEDKPVAVIGVDNIVIVNTPNGLIVARKDLSQKIGDISKRFQQ